MRFGIALPNSGPLAHPTAIQQVALEAEALGYESVWGHDHITYDVDWFEHRTSGIVTINAAVEPNFFESLTTLSYVAGLTRVIRLGIAILVLPLRDPRVLARQVMTLQALSRERFILGVGQGDYPADFRVMGIQYANRTALIEEYLQVLTVLLKGGHVTYSSQTLSFENASYYPRVERIPILLGGGIRYRRDSQTPELFEPTLHRIARWCDGWIPEGPPGLVAEGIQKIYQKAKEYGRENVQFEVRVATPLYIGPDDLVRDKVGRDLDYELVGSVTTIAKKIEAYRMAGADGVIMRCWADDLPSLLTMLRTMAQQFLST